jgi:type VI protein secretion system component VasK
MVSVSTARKLSILARVAAQHAKRTRTFGAFLQGGRTLVSHWGRVLNQLWLEVTGFVFLALAGIGGIAFTREYAAYHAGKPLASRLLIAILFTLMFGWFGVSSFWRVRKKSAIAKKPV